MLRLPYGLLLCLFTVVAAAQPSVDICTDDDCDPQVALISLTAPLSPGPEGFSPTHTAEFMAAYRNFRDMENRQLADAGWADKYRRFELGGSYCLRYYDLAGRFAYEYDQNEDFRAYVDRLTRNRSTLKSDGLAASRRSVDLLARLQRNCPALARRLEREQLLTSADRSAIHARLGGELPEVPEDVPDEVAVAGDEREKEQITEAETKIEKLEEEEEFTAEVSRIREAFGRDVEITPVTTGEFSDSSGIERPLWKASLNPDNEVVEGFKGRYFQVQLKDADQGVKLLFEPGAYFISRADFHEQYGPVLMALVAETRAAVRKEDRDKIRLFVQGSADITGSETFRGDLEEEYRYTEVSLLPADGAKKFRGSPEIREIPASGFTNEDLPNLRGQFLKEMISVYAGQLNPILLEGSVKEKVSAADRNAVIYLFLPEEILE